jgi:hypothetical protein
MKESFFIDERFFTDIKNHRLHDDSLLMKQTVAEF